MYKEVQPLNRTEMEYKTEEFKDYGQPCVEAKKVERRYDFTKKNAAPVAKAARKRTIDVCCLCIVDPLQVLFGGCTRTRRARAARVSGA